MKATTSLPVALALLLLLAGCVAPLQSTGTGTAADAAVTTIDVSGTGEAAAEADLAVVSVAVSARADTADDARGAVATDVESMRTALRDAGVPDEAVTTAFFRISPRYEVIDREREVIGFEAVHAFRIETDPGRAGEVVDLAVGNGADRVDGIAFTLSDERRADLRERALTGAVEAARADADAVAAATDLSITGVASASTSGGFVPVFDARVAEDAAGRAGAPTTLEPGPVTVTATVSVSYTAA
jgi:hypothetical protein